MPVLFEMLFVGLLTYLLHEADVEIQREKKSKAVIEATDQLTRSIMDAATAAGAFNVTKNTFFERRMNHAAAIVSDQLRTLELLLRDDPKQMANLDNIRNVTKSGLDLMLKLKTDEDQGNTLGALIGGPRFKGVGNFTTNLSWATRRLLDAERPLELASIERQQRAREYVGIVLVFGMALNIALAILLALFFSRGITRRLGTVMENTALLPTGAPLKPLLKGTDEIAELDRVFHRMAERLDQAEKMKMQLMAMVSHDLRSPLTSVQGTLTLLQMGALGEISAQAKERVEHAESDVERLIKLSNDLLDIEKLASGKLDMHCEMISLNKILEDSLHSLETFAEQHEVKLAVEATELRVFADRDRIIQVVVNLISNAIKYSPAKSTVTISSQPNGKFVLVKVIDKGRGVPAEFQQKIFERFQQVEESDAKEKGGKGLGLAICKSIVEQHGGAIGVDSKDGEGSVFWFTLPRTDPNLG